MGGVLKRVVLEGLDQDARAEDVIAHRREREFGLSGHGAGHGGLLVEVDDPPVRGDLENAEPRGLGDRHGNRRDREIVPALLVGEEHRVHVHHVDVVAAEHADVLGLLVEDQVEILVDGIRRPPEPVRSAAHLGRHGVHELADVEAEAPRADDVLDERVRLELRQDLDLREAGVDAVVEREIDDAVAAAKRDGGFRAVPCERKQTLAHPTGEDDREDVAMLQNLHAAPAMRCPAIVPRSTSLSSRGARRVS